MATVPLPSLKQARPKTSTGALLWELLEAMQPFRRDPLGSTDPCPVRATEMGREALAVTVQTTTCPVQTRGPNPPAPQGKSSDRIRAKQDPAKPVNPGETNLSRLFKCH